MNFMYLRRTALLRIHLVVILLFAILSAPFGAAEDTQKLAVSCPSPTLYRSQPTTCTVTPSGLTAETKLTVTPNGETPLPSLTFSVGATDSKPFDYSTDSAGQTTLNFATEPSDVSVDPSSFLLTILDPVEFRYVEDMSIWYEGETRALRIHPSAAPLSSTTLTFTATGATITDLSESTLVWAAGDGDDKTISVKAEEGATSIGLSVTAGDQKSSTVVTELNQEFIQVIAPPIVTISCNPPSGLILYANQTVECELEATNPPRDFNVSVWVMSSMGEEDHFTLPFGPRFPPMQLKPQLPTAGQLTFNFSEENNRPIVMQPLSTITFTFIDPVSFSYIEELSDWYAGETRVLHIHPSAVPRSDTNLTFTATNATINGTAELSLVWATGDNSSQAISVHPNLDAEAFSISATATTVASDEQFSTNVTALQQNLPLLPPNVIVLCNATSTLYSNQRTVCWANPNAIPGGETTTLSVTSTVDGSEPITALSFTPPDDAQPKSFSYSRPSGEFTLKFSLEPQPQVVHPDSIAFTVIEPVTFTYIGKVTADWYESETRTLRIHPSAAPLSETNLTFAATGATITDLPESTLVWAAGDGDDKTISVKAEEGATSISLTVTPTTGANDQVYSTVVTSLQQQDIPLTQRSSFNIVDLSDPLTAGRDVSFTITPGTAAVTGDLTLELQSDESVTLEPLTLTWTEQERSEKVVRTVHLTAWSARALTIDGIVSGDAARGYSNMKQAITIQLDAVDIDCSPKTAQVDKQVTCSITPGHSIRTALAVKATMKSQLDDTVIDEKSETFTGTPETKALDFTSANPSGATITFELSGENAAEFDQPPSQDVSFTSLYTFSLTPLPDPWFESQEVEFTVTPQEDADNIQNLTLSLAVFIDGVAAEKSIEPLHWENDDESAQAFKYTAPENRTGSTLTIKPELSGADAGRFDINSLSLPQFTIAQRATFTVSSEPSFENPINAGSAITFFIAPSTPPLRSVNVTATVMMDDQPQYFTATFDPGHSTPQDFTVTAIERMTVTFGVSGDGAVQFIAPEVQVQVNPKPKPPPSKAGPSDTDNIWIGVVAVIGIIIGVVCLERLYHSCKRVMQRRKGRVGFSQLSDQFGNPDADVDIDIQLAAVDHRSRHGDDHL